jgi:hypothetical protein
MSLLLLFDNVTIPHDAFIAAEERLQEMWEYIEAGGLEPGGFALMGDSRTGKSLIADRFVTAHPPTRTEDGIEVPVVLANVPGNPSVKGLAGVLLNKLGAHDKPGDSETFKTIKLIRLFKECKVRILYLEEFQHFADRGGKKTHTAVTDWLKNFIGETKVGLVISGLPHLQTVIRADPQLPGRFEAPVYVPRFHWENATLQDQWRNIVKAFDKVIRAHFDLPRLASTDLSFRLYLATGGLIGYLKLTLRRAVFNAIRKKLKVITLQDLCAAHIQAIWREQLDAKHATGESPLSPDFDATPSKELLAAARAIGEPSDFEHLKKEKSSKAKGAKSLGQTLSRS